MSNIKVLECTEVAGVEVAKRVMVRVAPAEKISRNNREYINAFVHPRIKLANEDIQLGKASYNFLSHPNPTIDQNTGEYAGFRYPKNRPWTEIAISRTVEYSIENEELYAIAEFLPTRVGQLWAMKARRSESSGEVLPVSWRTIAHCSGENQTGTCALEDFDDWDWLDMGEQPGFATAHMVAVIEKHDNPPCSCQKKEKAVKESQYMVQRSIDFHGLSINVEVNVGEMRFGTPMSVAYGHIENYAGRDGEFLDVYIGENLDSEHLFVIDQLTHGGIFDEQKFMIGFNSIKEAKDTYLAHMPPDMLGQIREIPMSYLTNFAPILDKDFTIPSLLVENSANSDVEFVNKLKTNEHVPKSVSEFLAHYFEAHVLAQEYASLGIPESAIHRFLQLRLNS